MSIAIHPGPAANTAATLHRFTVDFFTLLGAHVQLLDEDGAGALAVRLPATMVEHFGAPDLHLRFHQTADNQGELVAFGSRTFDRMMSFLNGRSALTVLALPKRYQGGEELLKAVRPANAGITALKMRETTLRWVAFNWHITYRADDKREELYTVIVDERGELIAQHGETKHDGSGPALDSLLRDGEEITPEPDAEDAYKLPAMTQLVRMAEQARKYAIYHADLRCHELEAEILPRLHKVLARLNSYYSQQIEEVYDAHDVDGAKRRALEQDMERKLAEEVENHRLRIQVTLFSYALLDLPTALAAISLSDGRHTVDVEVARNLYTGSIQPPHCHACGLPNPITALDRNGHLTCDSCITQCHACQEIYCAACGVAPCPVCGEEHCDACSTECWACGRRACHTHIDRCPICGDPVCFGCQTACATCGVRQCRSHLRADAVSSIAENDAAPVLICTACAVRCPGCQQFSAQLGTCDLSGQRFCLNCLVTCAACGKQVGLGFYLIDARTGTVRCHQCTSQCPGCGRFATEVEACAVCGAGGCAACLTHCDVCRTALCRDHALQLAECGHVLCPDHLATCASGGEMVCPVCMLPCGICGRSYCHEHRGVCRRCQREYCNECIRISGLCDTCSTMDRDGEFVTLVDEPCAGDSRVQLLMNRYRWMRLDNMRYTYYLGRDAQMQAALIVVERTAAGYEVRRAAKLGPLDTQYRERWA